MACPIQREERRGDNGKITSYTFYLIKPINSAVLNKLKSNQRTANTSLPRNAAFANITILDSAQEEHLANDLGKAINIEELPADLRAMFAEDGSVLPSERSKIAYIGFIDRTNENFKTQKREGTFVLKGNIESVFDITLNKIASNNVLKKYYLPNENNNAKSQLHLLRGSPSQLLECLLGPTSPLHEMGVKYIVLHPVSRELETNFYGRKFGFKPILGIPASEGNWVLEQDGISLNRFTELKPATQERGGPEIRTLDNLYLRMLDKNVYLTYESQFNGPIMYKKLADPERPATQVQVAAPAPASAAASASQPARLSQHVNKKPSVPRYSKKQMARLLYNRNITKTRKAYAPSKPQYSKGTRKRPQRG